MPARLSVYAPQRIVFLKTEVKMTNQILANLHKEGIAATMTSTTGDRETRISVVLFSHSTYYHCYNNVYVRTYSRST